MTDFSLRQLVRDVLATSMMCDPHDLADEVLRRIDDSNLRVALRQCLSDVVREQIRQSRNSIRIRPLAPETQQPASPTLAQVPDVMQELPSGAAAVKPRTVARSAKVAAIRDHHHRWLRERIHTGNDPRQWKRRGDCEFEDLMFASGQRRDQARRTSAAADELERLAVLLHEHGVGKVRDLPEHVLRAFEGGAAA